MIGAQQTDLILKHLLPLIRLHLKFVKIMNHHMIVITKKS